VVKGGGVVEGRGVVEGGVDLSKLGRVGPGKYSDWGWDESEVIVD
jgi:hypothetical protein